MGVRNKHFRYRDLRMTQKFDFSKLIKYRSYVKAETWPEASLTQKLLTLCAGGIFQHCAPLSSHNSAFNLSGN